MDNDYGQFVDIENLDLDLNLNLKKERVNRQFNPIPEYNFVVCLMDIMDYFSWMMFNAKQQL
jgi:hypothetical protein